MIRVLSVFVIMILPKDFVLADCGVVTREQWDGLSPTRVEYLPRPVGLVIMMHTVSSPCNTDQTCAAQVRNLQTYFLDQLNYWDLGPSFLIGGNGKVYEGPGWLHVGAHTYGYNRKSIGISFIGNFNNDKPTPEALAAAKALIKCGMTKGHLKRDYKVVGARQLIATESPGRKLYQEIRNWPDWTDNLDGIKNN
ncbi:peptidoglycan recognition protein-like [Leguminivora glycinivorella]|uniref:peptidoglycan recognition protein-like n=1 Tax=Leguminivora glycinivorella TaxID=1035111 RepID=UPI0020109D2D|nr:peptidoglycan recognition protein-like [Leguminivora glycinivorella]